MGLSINYSGQLMDPALITELMIEVVDICKELDWAYHLITGSNSDKLTGIVMSPAGCEPICLTSLPDGKLCSPFTSKNRKWYEENELDPELMYTTSTKTQYASMETHIAIIKLLKHLKEKYFSVFELVDEGGYWETMDEKTLIGRFETYETAINRLAEALGQIEPMENETAESMADRIERLLIEKLGNNK